MNYSQEYVIWGTPTLIQTTSLLGVPHMTYSRSNWYDWYDQESLITHSPWNHSYDILVVISITWIKVGVTHIREGRTGWRKLAGCLKLQVICYNRATNYRALLRTMTCKDKASYDLPPLCNSYHPYFGCLKLQIIFHKRATNYRSLSQKMTYNSTPPCNSCHPYFWCKQLWGGYD